MHVLKLKVMVQKDRRIELQLPADFPEGPAEVIVLTNRQAGGTLRQSLTHPHPESLEMAEVGFAAWAEGLSEDDSDLIAPDAGDSAPKGR